MKKRVLSMFMALALCLTLLPAAAFAEGEDVSISGGVIGGGETGGEGGGVLVPPGGSTGEGGGIYVAPGGPTEGGGGTYIPGEATRTEIRCVSKPDSIGRSYDGTTDGGTIPIDLTFTDGTNEIKLKEGTGFTAKKTFDSADAGRRTVTVEITLIGEAAAKYKLKAGEEKFEIGGNINKAYPKLNVSLSKTTCAVGEKILPLLSVEGAPEDAEVTYYYLAAELKNWAGSSDAEGGTSMPAIDENTAISKPGTYYVYAKTGETKNYEEERSATVELTVSEKVDPVVSVTTADGTETPYGSFVDAWTAAVASEGSTLKLLADGTLSGDNTDISKSITLDLNGYVLGSNGSLTVKNGAALTVRNAGAEKSEKPVKAGLYLTLLVEKGGSFTCTDGGLRYLGLLSAGTGDYAIQLAEGESHCTFGGFAQGDESATAGDLLKATPGMALYGDYNGSDVRIERSTRISSGFTYLSFYVGPCSEHKMDANGTCIYCGASYVASVTASGGESTNYTSLDDALDAMKDGDTVTLLSDAKITRWPSLSKAFTLELNGKTATTQSKAELYLHARVTVQDSSTGKTGGMAGTALLNVQSNGDLIIKSGTFNGRIAMNDGKLTIKGGTFNQEVDLPRGDSDSVFFSGGTFAKIWYPNSSGSFLDLLADGYAFYDNDGKLVNAAEITGRYLYNVHIGTHAHSFTGGACACGYTCPHTSVDESGACTVCGKQFAASITKGDDVTYYDRFTDALVYATRNDGCTLKLLADVTGTAVMINNPFLFDLNGHNVYALSVDARATIKDSGTTKGRIGKVTVSDTKVPGLTLGDLLEEGYAFKYGNGYWANDSYLQTTEGSFVTVEKAPIQSVNVYAKDKNNQKILTIAYGATGEVTLVSSCKLSETSGADLTYLWYKLEGAAATAPLEGATGANYTLPDNLAAGTHTYLLICTSDGYSKSKEITITVTPISLEGATVTVSNLTYNGNPQEPTVTVKLGDETLSRDNDYTVQVTKQTDAGSYKLTIKGGGNYSGEIEDVEWKIEPMKIDHVMVSSDISKVYDGTAEINMSANEWATALKFKTLSASGVVDVPSSAYTISNAYFVEKSGEETIHSPDAGEKYGISFKITLKSNNYVLQTYDEDTPSTSKVITQSGGATFTIKQATVTSPGEITQLVFNDLAKTYTIDLPALPALDGEKTYGDTQYAVDQSSVKELTQGYNAIQDVGFAVNPDNGKTQLTFHAPAVKNQTEGSVGAIKITVTPTNYEPVTLTVKLQSVNKRKLGMFVSVATDPIVYGMTLGDIKLSAEATVGKDNQVIPGTIAWEDPLTTVPAAGRATYRWTFTPDDTMHYLTASNTITFLVDKATPTGAPTYTAITTGGKTLADAPLTPNASWPSGTVQWVDKDGKPLPASTQVQANTKYTWSFTPADAANYNGATGSVTLYSVSTGGGGSSSASKTSTTTNADGSVTKTEIKADGTVIATTTAKDGSVTRIETKPDGSSVTQRTLADGSTGTVKTDKNGQTTAETALSSKAIEDAKRNGEPVKAPVEVEATRNSSTAPTVKIELPRNSGDTKVEIPVSNVKPGTVAVLVHADGTEEIVKNSLPTEDGIQLTVNGGATVKIVDNSKDFIDTRNHWAKDAIDFVSARGLVNGMNDSIYAPNNSTTRAQLWTILARQNDADLNGGNTWYEKAQLWSKNKGISDGTEPNAAINRAQMVTMLWRTVGQPTAGGTANFTDVPADSYYASAVAWAVENGITDGVGDGRFDPAHTCTRAQIATFLYRLYLSR